MHGALSRSVTVALAVAVSALSLSCVGCSSVSSCNREADFETVADGLVYGNTYISARNDSEQRGPWAYFPPQRTLVFEHKLDGIPHQIAIWLAFQEEGTLAPAAGNLSIRQFTEDDKIAIKNDTCSTYYAWVEASLPVYSGFEGEAGASSVDQTAAAGSSGLP